MGDEKDESWHIMVSFTRRIELLKTAFNWRCADKNCRVPLKTAVLDIESPPVYIPILERVADDEHHGHFPDLEAVEKLKITNIMKNKVAANPSAPIKRTYDDTVANLQHLATPPDPEDVPLFDVIAQTW